MLNGIAKSSGHYCLALVVPCLRVSPSLSLASSVRIAGRTRCKAAPTVVSKHCGKDLHRFVRTDCASEGCTVLVGVVTVFAVCLCVPAPFIPFPRFLFARVQHALSSAGWLCLLLSGFHFLCRGKREREYLRKSRYRAAGCSRVAVKQRFTRFVFGQEALLI